MPEKKTRDGALQRLKRYLNAYSGGEEPILRSLGQRPYLELSADRQLLIEGCGGILDYEEDRLALSAGRLTVTVHGEGLTIRSLQEGTALITGIITAVEYTSREGRR